MDFIPVAAFTTFELFVHTFSLSVLYSVVKSTLCLREVYYLGMPGIVERRTILPVVNTTKLPSLVLEKYTPLAGFLQLCTLFIATRSAL